MRKFTKIFAIVLVVMTFVGCSADNGYHYYEQDGQYYIRLDDEFNDQTMPDAGGYVIPVEIKFATFDEMIQDITTGNFSEWELKGLAWNAWIVTYDPIEKTHSDLPVCDLTTLWEPIVPDGYQWENILWIGPEYSFLIVRSDICIRVLPGDCQMERIAESMWEMIFFDGYSDGSPTTSIETEEDRNATVYYSDLKSGTKRKDVIYSFSNGTHTTYVREMYNLETSTSVPCFMDVLVASESDESEWMYFDMYNLTERPSMQWLAALGMKKYDP